MLAARLAAEESRVAAAAAGLARAMLEEGLVPAPPVQAPLLSGLLAGLSQPDTATDAAFCLDRALQAPAWRALLVLPSVLQQLVAAVAAARLEQAGPAGTMLARLVVVTCELLGQSHAGALFQHQSAMAVFAHHLLAPLGGTARALGHLVAPLQALIRLETQLASALVLRTHGEPAAKRVPGQPTDQVEHFDAPTARALARRLLGFRKGSVQELEACRIGFLVLSAPGPELAELPKLVSQLRKFWATSLNNLAQSSQAADFEALVDVMSVVVHAVPRDALLEDDRLKLVLVAVATLPWLLDADVRGRASGEQLVPSAWGLLTSSIPEERWTVVRDSMLPFVSDACLAECVLMAVLLGPAMPGWSRLVLDTALEHTRTLVRAAALDLLPVFVTHLGFDVDVSDMLGRLDPLATHLLATSQQQQLQLQLQHQSQQQTPVAQQRPAREQHATALARCLGPLTCASARTTSLSAPEAVTSAHPLLDPSLRGPAAADLPAIQLECRVCQSAAAEASADAMQVDGPGPAALWSVVQAFLVALERHSAVVAAPTALALVDSLRRVLAHYPDAKLTSPQWLRLLRHSSAAVRRATHALLPQAARDEDLAMALITEIRDMYPATPDVALLQSLLQALGLLALHSTGQALLHVIVGLLDMMQAPEPILTAFAYDELRLLARKSSASG